MPDLSGGSNPTNSSNVEFEELVGCALSICQLFILDPNFESEMNLSSNLVSKVSRFKGSYHKSDFFRTCGTTHTKNLYVPCALYCSGTMQATYCCPQISRAQTTHSWSRCSWGSRREGVLAQSIIAGMSRIPRAQLGSPRHGCACCVVLHVVRGLVYTV